MKTIPVHFVERYASFYPVGWMILVLSFLVAYLLWKKMDGRKGLVAMIIALGIGLGSLGISYLVGMSWYPMNDRSVSTITAAIAKDKGWTYVSPLATQNGEQYVFVEKDGKKYHGCIFELAEPEGMNRNFAMSRKGDRSFDVSYKCSA